MDLALNNLQRLICHKTQTTNQLSNFDAMFCGVVQFATNYKADAYIRGEILILILTSWLKDSLDLENLRYKIFFQAQFALSESVVACLYSV